MVRLLAGTAAVTLFVVAYDIVDPSGQKRDSSSSLPDGFVKSYFTAGTVGGSAVTEQPSVAGS